MDAEGAGGGGAAAHELGGQNNVPPQQQQAGVAAAHQFAQPAALPRPHRMLRRMASGEAGPSDVAQSARCNRPSSACVTRMDPLRLSQRWKIENFDTVMKLSRPGMCLRSNVFKHANFPEACWQLCLYPNGKREENVNNVSLFLKMSSTVPSKEVMLKAEYRFYFLDEAGNEKFNNVNIGDFHAKPPKGGHSWGLRNIPRPKVQGALQKDESLMILCEIELIPDPSKVKCQVERRSAVAASDVCEVPARHIDALTRLHEQRIFSDCVVSVPSENKEFRVHKCILAAHSDVFRAMFEHDNTVEATNNRLQIEEFSSFAVQQFFAFLYTGSISLDYERHPDICDELLGLSEKYAIAHLKALVEDACAAKLDATNVCHLLQLADLYRAEHLKEAALEHFIAARHHVLASDRWAELKSCNPSLASEILELVLRAGEGSGGNNPSPVPPFKRCRSSQAVANFAAPPPPPQRHENMQLGHDHDHSR